MISALNIQQGWRLSPFWRLMVALWLVYIVWGTTYFAIGVAVHSFPPLWMNATRFTLAGVIMLAWALWRGEKLPSWRQWRNAALVGGLMVFVSMNLVVFAQKQGIGSGLMATVITTMPMWLALWTRLGGERVPTTSWVGLVLGVAGALLLAMEGDFSASWLGALAAFGAPLCWSVGSYASRKLDLPGPAMASATEWLAGGLMGVVAASLIEPQGALGNVSHEAWLAWWYLLVFGTLIALNAYLWLLQNTTAAVAGSYSFVNPAVALVVGVVIGKEVLTGWVFLALPLIAGALAMIMYGPAMVGWVRGLRSLRIAR
jgi:drug/metabolite transporter (DMT)-like permease